MTVDDIIRLLREEAQYWENKEPYTAKAFEGFVKRVEVLDGPKPSGEADEA